MPLDGWDIQVAAARGVVTLAKADVDRLEAQETALTTSFEEAATACDHLDIGDALDSVLSGFAGPLLQSARNAGYSICGNTGLAIDAYVAGDDDMAADAETAIHSVPAVEGGDRTEAY
ncbi:DUF6507 family protein [Zafaria sp. Z1313]|uniref:DUF6507 family protein n=1 Tax=unclassified Zafaria TaxID=2828765 RepID=UPI002E7631C3|nr:DUF6507 family protein [Zafaria sp. J156]MEE1621787.1 DUF6507 family protein [Zafaria sp. J156]